MTASIRNNLLAVNASLHLKAHYNELATSVRRLSSGLRVERAADDAAGLAIRELMRADVATLHQGARNVNDAISLIQTADGALGVIDEKLIRMKELAEQAATGTYDSTQRLMIDSEFQQMASEIERIARATDFNGIHLLDGSLSGPHDGSQLEATGALKVHFGTANDSAEDYYYIEIGDATLKGLGLMDGVENAGNNQGAGNVGGGGGGAGYGGVPILSDKVQQGIEQRFNSGIISFGIIPAGTTNLSIRINDNTYNDDIQIFTRDGKHIAGTTLASWNMTTPNPQDFISENNGFLPNATYDSSQLNGTGGNLNFIVSSALHDFNYNGMRISYSGNGNPSTFPGPSDWNIENLQIDTVTEDLIVIISGTGTFDITANWTTMPAPGTQPGGDPTQPVDPALPNAEGGTLMSIKTQELAQKGIVRLNEAIVRKDQIRAHLGAVQNRLENTVTNLNIQAENLQNAESRISDVDVATEMTTFVRNQVLTQSASSMLAQANSFPHMLMELIGG